MADPNEDKLARAQRIRALYNDPTMQEMLSGTLGDLYREWLYTEPHDVQARERIYSTALAVRCLKSRFDEAVEPAEMADAKDRVASDEARLERERRAAEERDAGA